MTSKDAAAHAEHCLETAEGQIALPPPGEPIAPEGLDPTPDIFFRIERMLLTTLAVEMAQQHVTAEEVFAFVGCAKTTAEIQQMSDRILRDQLVRQVNQGVDAHEYMRKTPSRKPVEDRRCVTCAHASRHSGLPCPPHLLNDCQPSGGRWTFVHWTPAEKTPPAVRTGPGGDFTQDFYAGTSPAV